MQQNACACLPKCESRHAGHNTTTEQFEVSCETAGVLCFTKWIKRQEGENMNQKQYTAHVGRISCSSSDNGELAVDAES